MKSETEFEIAMPDDQCLEMSKSIQINTEHGQGYLFTMGQIYDKPKRRFEIEMCFIVVDKRNANETEKTVKVFPIHFWDDRNDVEEQGVKISKEGKIEHVNPHFQRANVNTAQKWLLDLKACELVMK